MRLNWKPSTTPSLWGSSQRSSLTLSVTRNGRGVLVMLVALGLTGCELDLSSMFGGEEEAPQAEPQVRTPKRPKDEKKEDATPSPEEERLAYSYNPIGKRDPFRSFIAKDPVSPESPVETPLQKYEIDQYRLVGIIWGSETPTAMVEDPEGMGHFLVRDTLIGRNWGKVVRISPTEVIVAEEYRDFEGKLIVNEIPLRLPADEKDARK